MSIGFYRAFEDKYRGSRGLIKSRLTVYKPFIQAAALCSDAHAVDLGCGRGEWLELLGELNVPAHGVDMDAGMLDACRERNLSVETGDAIAFLKQLADESQVLVTAFHLAEHLPFEVLQTLVQEALRVLRPAGLLIMETPNPENLSVGATSFYMDPTHERPLPPQLLSFLPDYYGFERVKIVRLQESSELASGHDASLLQVLTGVSPDYAVIAQKTAAEDALQPFNEAFDVDYGLTLEQLAQRYEKRMEFTADQFYVLAQQAEARVQRAESRTQRAETCVEEADARAKSVEAHAKEAEARAEEAEARAQRAELHSQQAEVDARQAIDVLAHVYASLSWKLTLPLRLAKKAIAYVLSCVVGATKYCIRQPVVIAAKIVLRYPLLRSWASKLSRKFPFLRQRFVFLAHGLQTTDSPPPSEKSTPKTFSELGSIIMMTSIADTLVTNEEGNEIAFV